MIWCAIWPPVTLLHNFQLTLREWKLISVVCGLTPFEVQYGVSWLSTSVSNTNKLQPLQTLPRAALTSKTAKLAACVLSVSLPPLAAETPFTAPTRLRRKPFSHSVHKRAVVNDVNDRTFICTVNNHTDVKYISYHSRSLRTIPLGNPWAYFFFFLYWYQLDTQFFI